MYLHDATKIQEGFVLHNQEQRGMYVRIFNDAWYPESPSAANARQNLPRGRNVDARFHEPAWKDVRYPY